MSPDIQIFVTFAFFLVLLACGMAVPFAIAVPAMFYLLLQGGLQVVVDQLTSGFKRVQVNLRLSEILGLLAKL